MYLQGYFRPDGSVGIRNHVLILSSVVCSNEVARAISNNVPGTVVITHNEGCGQLGADYEQTLGTIVGIGKNPQCCFCFGSWFGCEKLDPYLVAEEISTTGKPVEVIVIQERKWHVKAKEKGA